MLASPRRATGISITIWLACCCGFSLPVPASADDAIALRIDTAKASRDLQIEPQDSQVYELHSVGNDAYLIFDIPQTTALTGGHVILEFEAFSPRSVLGLEVFLGPPFKPQSRIVAGSIPRSESWMPVTIDLGNDRDASKLAFAPDSQDVVGKSINEFRKLRVDFGQQRDRTLQVRNFKLRPPTQKEIERKVRANIEVVTKLAQQARREQFFAAKLPATITGVRVDAQSVSVQTSPPRSKSVSLLELAPEFSFASDGRIAEDRFFLSSDAGILSINDWTGKPPVSLPRFADVTGDGTRDRITSRWVMAIDRGEESDVPGRWELVSHPRYADDLDAAASSSLAKQNAKGLKGMGGISAHYPLGELLELGIEHITINVVLNHLVDSKSHPAWETMRVDGRDWWVNTRSLRHIDKVTRFARDHDMVVSAILLVRFGDGDHEQQLIHPEADPAGHYAMPNLTCHEGVQAYQASLELLARRYLAEGSPHGRIANWIVHNEVGYGWEWTNMGRQPLGLFVDHYLRSMRLVHNTTRRYDRHARVFISLTHHWETPPDPTWRSYSNRKILAELLRSTRIEGDFAWGIAYHPYPENLRQPDVWDDQTAIDDDRSPRITIKNLQVLDRWMQRPKMLDSKGQIRGLILSEQGFNTPDESDRSQRVQAAAFLYTWQKLRQMKTVEAFHNHRWIDSADEGGLRLGIRTLPSKQHPFGRKKLAWEVYRAIDTPDEEKYRPLLEEQLR
ncbi:MAG: DUF5722 domain-containing protein [Planctomycetota bacterium]